MTTNLWPIFKWRPGTLIDDEDDIQDAVETDKDDF